MTSRLVWGHSALALVLETGGPVRLVVNEQSGQPLVEVLVAGEGSSWSGSRGIDTAVGARLRYAGHRERTADGWSVLEVDLVDERLAVTVTFRTRDGLAAFQTWTRVRATGTDPITLHAVSSFAAWWVLSGPQRWLPAAACALVAVWLWRLPTRPPST